MSVVATRIGLRRVIVSRPDGTTPSAVAIALAGTFATARRAGAAACVLPPRAMADDPMWKLVPGDAPRLPPAGAGEAWCRSRWRLYEASSRGGEALRRWSASFWRELHRELRRQAGDERLPIDLRGRLRETAHRALQRSTAADRAAGVRLPRRLLRERVAVCWPPEVAEEARDAAAEAGLDLGAPIAALETRCPIETVFDLVDELASRGYVVARIGDAPAGAVRRPGLVDVTAARRRRLIETAALLACRFLVCESPELQRVTYLTNTPSVLLNAHDPFSAYPIRADGVFTQATPVDLDTGRVLALDETLSEPFYRNLRNCGFRPAPASDAVAAIRELEEGLAAGFQDSDAQARVRAQVTAAGAAMAERVRHVEKWGPDEGFIGDGRLARIQAERT